MKILVLVCSVLLAAAPHAEDPSFYRGINLGGPAVSIDGHQWESDAADNVKISAQSFENQDVRLKPPTDPERARMIRSSRWGGKVDLELSNVPEGTYQVFLYVWEDNNNEQFDLLVNERPVLKGFRSGTAGMWKRLGPWKTDSVDGKLRLATRGGAANLSGLEIWAGEGEIPDPTKPKFLTELTAEQTDFFEKRIRPLLVENCYECHSAGAKELKGGLLLDSRAGLMKGGNTGPVVYPGLPEASLLVQAVHQNNPDLSMPPDGKLADGEIADFEEWVRMGAPDPRTDDTVAVVKARTAIKWEKAREWWSFRPINRLNVPNVKNEEWPANEIDRFVLARLEKESLEPSPDASRRVLIRRATFDLTGLPPTPAEIDDFLNDREPGAFARVVDRLLDSPHYGERWARHWMDVVRYADTAGDNSDFPIPQMYRYRNWIIDAFNRDLPYNEFVRQQLAGDLLPADSLEERNTKLIATGYIANARRFGSRVSDYPQHLTIEDTIDNLGRSFLGLTVSCARCHDHKFDPITAADYYALYGIFASTRYPWPGIELEQKQRDLIPLVTAEKANELRNDQREKQEKLNEEVKRLEKELKEAEGDEKKELEKELEKAKNAANDHEKSPPPYEQAYAVAESSNLENAAIHLKGDPAKPGEVVPRRFLMVLGGAEVENAEKVSGRLQLASWITDPKNSLTARVMANRIWLHHFGKGIVPTPNDYGRQGKPPTHPELLDWLASRFIKSGWSVKAMHRMIMLSRTYQLSSERTPESLEKDANNDLLASFPRRRLPAESIRDSMLAVAGNLDFKPGGPHPFPPQEKWNFTQHNPFKAVYETRQRSVYLMTQRIQRHPFLAIFDGADPAASTAVRLTSTTPVQALYLLNDPFVHEQASTFAERLMSASADPEKRLHLAYLLAVGRPPTPGELEQQKTFLASVTGQLHAAGTHGDVIEREAWSAVARVIFRLNEFVYID